MAGQDGLEQVGSDLSLKESMVYDDTSMQEDAPPRSDPEVVMGAGVAAYDPPCIKFPSRPLADPRPTEANQLRQGHLTWAGSWR